MCGKAAKNPELVSKSPPAPLHPHPYPVIPIFGPHPVVEACSPPDKPRELLMRRPEDHVTPWLPHTLTDASACCWRASDKQPAWSKQTRENTMETPPEAGSRDASLEEVPTVQAGSTDRGGVAGGGDMRRKATGGVDRDGGSRSRLDEEADPRDSKQYS